MAFSWQDDAPAMPTRAGDNLPTWSFLHMESFRHEGYDPNHWVDDRPNGEAAPDACHWLKCKALPAMMK